VSDKHLGCYSLDSDRGVNEDVVVEGVAAESKKNQVLPTGVGGRLGLEDDQDEESDVLDTPGLVVKLRHERVGRVMPDEESDVLDIRWPDESEEVAPASWEVGEMRSCSASLI
jgi:hypothetical protein